MAFGRSNSLSINTGSTPSLFGNTQNNSTQPQQQSTGLFGNTGNTGNTSQPQQSTSAFGSTPAQPQQSGGGLFGNNNPTQSQTSGGLFGNNNATQSQPSGGLFGTNNTGNTQSSGTGLFGAPTQQSQPQQSGGLFGSTLGQPQQQSSSLFGNPAGQNNQTQNQSSGGLFGSLAPLNNSVQPQNSVFGGPLFQPSGSSTAPLVGSLTMGQGNAPQNTVPGTKIDLSNLRPTTRFNDLHDDLKKQIEAIDAFIRQQESYSSQCEALLPNHSTNVDSLKPDVEFITGKIETVELALENDSRTIESAKALVKRDATDLMRCARVTENLTLPSQYHYGPTVTAARSRSAPSSGDDDYDVDLVGYFMRQADAMQSTLNTYTSNLAEIESHLRVIEFSTIQQAQQIAAQRTGSRASNGQDTVRELADTLRGFENGILGAAGLIGSCREGVNELVLGRIGGDARDSQSYGGRRSVRF